MEANGCVCGLGMYNASEMKAVCVDSLFDGGRLSASRPVVHCEVCPSCIVCEDQGASSGMHMHIRVGYAVTPIERAASFVNAFHWDGTEH